ncbi:hypothetical protein L208DRAFT_1409162 [Tricholoma matsutake]|nr:hypothetical protein L208DRAFT_1409162 [Tricholoma matsutake 945]
MSLSLWRLQCSAYLRLGHRHYASAVVARTRRKSLPSPNADSLFAEPSPDHLQQSEEIQTPTVVNSTRKIATGRLAKKSLRPKEEIISHRNLLEQTKVQEYLDFVASTSNTVTLADIERCRPPEYGAPGTSEYESDYNLLLDTLVRSFSTKQLRRFLHLYQLDLPKKRTKWHYAASIIERQWGWPSLTEIQKQQRDWTEVTYATFPLDPRQAFLILGKDGADLLSLSLRHNLHVSFSASPLSLKAEGLRGSLDNLSQYINEFKDSIKYEYFELPFGHTNEHALLERISRLSGAFTENVGRDGMIRVSYKSEDVSAANLAKKLATRAAFELAIEVPTLVYSPTRASSRATPLTTLFPHRYSLYPFLPPRALPWLGNGRNLFRLRRVGEWLSVDTRDDGEQDGDLVDRCGIAVNFVGEESDIRDGLLNQCSGQLEGADGTKRVFTASFGHLLIPSPSSKRVTLTSPLEGRSDLSNILEWVRSHGVKPAFVPSLPVPLLNTPPAEQRFIHRLTYGTLPAIGRETGTPQTPTALKFEVTLGLSDTKSVSEGDTADHPQHKSSVNKTIDLAPMCSVGPEAHLNLMIPDRSMDIRFSLFNYLSLSQDKWPQGLQNYFRDLQAFLSVVEGSSQPDAPLILEHQDVTYVLQSNSSIRQSSELVSTTVSGLDAHTHFHTISESSLDLESSQKSIICQVICEDATSDVAWTSFFNNCEDLAAFRQDRRLEA